MRTPPGGIPIRVSRVKILYCIDSIGYNAGSEIQLAEIIRRIDKERFEIHLCCLEDSERARELSSSCTPLILTVPKILSLAGIRQILALHSYIRENRIDVVHTWMIDSNILGILAAIRSGCKATISSRRNLGYWMTASQVRLYRVLDRFTTRLLANSAGVRDFVVQSEGVPASKVDILYNGVDTELFRPGGGDPAVVRELGIPDEAKVVGIVGNLRPVKDHATFLAAARLVADRVPSAAFLLAGSGPLREDLARRARELGIADRVYFTDGKGSTRDYLERMDVACLTSRSEGFSNSLLEYMSTGLPIVATDTGGNSDAIEDGVSGFLVPVGDPEPLAARIVELLTDHGKAAAMGSRARSVCVSRYEFARVIPRYESYYRKLATGQDS